MQMRQHRPESPHHGSIHSHPKLRQVPFQKRSHKTFPPRRTVRIVSGQIRTWKASSQPQTLLCSLTRLTQIKAMQIDKLDATG